MSPIRIVAAGLVAAAVASPALAQSCIQPTERVAFDVRALQSQMMVSMLQCDQAQQDAYGQFIRRYDAQLKEAFRGIQGHYRRTGGARGERQVDTYVTSLANAQSMDAQRQGTNFCRNMAPIFQQALAAPNSMQALAELAARNNIGNPHGRAECGGATPATTTRPARGRSADAEARPARRG